MYQEFYGLRELPFELTANPHYLYLTPSHREALSNLQYGLSTAKSITLLIGEAGTGKTTLLKTALQSERCSHVRAVHIDNPTLIRSEFVEMLARSFRLSPRAGQSKTVLLEELERALIDRRSQGEITALVVDEAQGLTTEILEEIRLLSNIETPDQKLLPVVLVGQPELAVRLEEPGLRQLKQRVALRAEITPLDLSETAAYIASRIKAAGGVAFKLFTREAVVLVHEYSQGIPRIVSVICDNALATAFALGKQPVDRDIVLEVTADFRLVRQRAGMTTPSTGNELRPTEGARAAQERPEPHAGEQPAEGAAAQPRFRFLGGRRR